MILEQSFVKKTEAEAGFMCVFVGGGSGVGVGGCE